MKKLIVIAVTLLLLCSFSAIASADVHSVTSGTPFFLIDGLNGNTYNNLSGCSSINWKETTRYGFFNAKIRVNGMMLDYEFQLITVGNAAATNLQGLWDIKRNGVLVASGIVGELTQLMDPIGSWFVFTGGDSQNNTGRWVLGAFITTRFDY